MIKQENMEYKRAVHHAAVVLNLCAKAKKNVKDLFESPDVCCAPSDRMLARRLVRRAYVVAKRATV